MVKDAKSELRQMWATPADFWSAINATFDFQRDVCATAYNTKCEDFISPEQDALAVPWFDDNVSRVWCNPGFSNMYPWVQKAYEETVLHPGSIAVVLTIPSFSTKWWKQYSIRASSIWNICGKRIQFDPHPAIKRSSNSRENCVLIFQGEEGWRDRDQLDWYWSEGDKRRSL